MDKVVDEHGLPRSDILVNPPTPLSKSYSDSARKTVVVGWGDSGEPSWHNLIVAYGLCQATHLACFNLNKRLGVDGKFLVYLPGDASEYWGRKVQRGQQKLFIEGYYIRAVVPYGLKKVPVKVDNDGKGYSRQRYLLAPGAQEEIEIVRLIFDLYVNGDKSLTEISNLLSAQRITSPGYNAPWTWANVKTVLENPFYIGSNKYGNSIRHDVFYPILDKSLYFEAQAKLNRECVSKSIVQNKKLT